MFSAADLIQALQRRLQLVAPHRRRAPGEFPPGWQAWFASMTERAGAITGATADAVIAVFLLRPLAMPPRRVGELSRWQAFATLWRQQWHPASRDDRRARWFAGVFTALWHLFVGAMLLYLMYLRFMAVSAPPEGDTVVQVEYIGIGTPDAPGGGPEQPSEQPEPAPQGQPAPATPTAVESPTAAALQEPQPPSLEAPVPDVAQRDVPEPQLPPPAVEQPVAVSEPTPSEPSVFVLPPTRRSPEPSVATPQLSTSPQAVRAIEVPEPVQPIRRELPQRELTAPTIDARAPEVAVREVTAPLQRAPVRELPQPSIAAPELRSTTPDVRVAEIPAPAASAPAASSSSTTPAPAAAPTSTTSTSTSTSSAPVPPSRTTGTPQASGARPATSAGAGPKPTPAPGSWPTPRRADDWGDSTRNQPGGEPGLYNSDGSVRLADTPGSASPGQPPGTITQEIKDLDRAGTWLRRKPNDFEPTSFDKYWVPSETLLAEWVRKGIKKVAIPIPGTNKRIECVVSMLGLGGGCGITDPNLNEQPAGARPPPDVPFKPALQEDNGSVKPD